MKAQMTLGEIIAALKRKDPDDEVYCGFVYFQPYGVHSYRGDYSQLAIGYKVYGRDEHCTVRDLLTQLSNAVGMRFTGYKGGEYEMTESTRVYIANHNESGGTAIVDVRDGDGRIVFETALID